MSFSSLFLYKRYLKIQSLFLPGHVRPAHNWYGTVLCPDGPPSLPRRQDDTPVGPDPSGRAKQEQAGQEEDRHHVRRGHHNLHRVLGPLPPLLPPGLPPPLHHPVPTHR